MENRHASCQGALAVSNPLITSIDVTPKLFVVFEFRRVCDLTCDRHFWPFPGCCAAGPMPRPRLTGRKLTAPIGRLPVAPAVNSVCPFRLIKRANLHVWPAQLSLFGLPRYFATTLFGLLRITSCSIQPQIRRIVHPAIAFHRRKVRHRGATVQGPFYQYPTDHNHLYCIVQSRPIFLFPDSVSKGKSDALMSILRGARRGLCACQC